MAKNWNDIKDGFVEGFVNAHYLMSQANKTGFDGAAVRRKAEQQAFEHVRILKEAEAPKKTALQKQQAKEAPLDAIFSGKE
jgi:hypothetical protein